MMPTALVPLRTAIGALTLLLLALALATFAWAQEQGTIAGTVTRSDTGGGAPAVQVTITNHATGQQSTHLTAPNGMFTGHGLAAGGPYSVTVELLGFDSQTADNIYVNANQTQEVDFTLNPSQNFAPNG